jgi:hypothetical protein
LVSSVRRSGFSSSASRGSSDSRRFVEREGARGGLRDGGAQVVVDDGLDVTRKRGWERDRFGHGPRFTAFDGALRKRKLAGTKHDAFHGDALLSELPDDGVRQHRQLRRPRARGSANDEHAPFERDRDRLIGDASADRLPPKGE